MSQLPGKAAIIKNSVFFANFNFLFFQDFRSKYEVVEGKYLGETDYELRMLLESLPDICQVQKTAYGHAVLPIISKVWGKC